MNIPLGLTLTILSYRDFYDVPRLILAGDQRAGFWILDCPFNDATDDYSQTYAVFFVGHDLPMARSVFETWSRGRSGLSVGVIGVDHVRFDDTRRSSLVCSPVA